MTVAVGVICLGLLSAGSLVFQYRIREGFWLRKLEKGDEPEKLKAIERLGLMGSERAAPVLIEHFSSYGEEVAQAAIQGVVRIGPPAVPSLVKAIKSDCFYVRRAALDALGTLGPGAASAIPILIEFFKDPVFRLQTLSWSEHNGYTPERDEKTRIARTLLRIGPRTREVLEVLEEAGKGDDSNLRYAAGVVLKGK